MHGNEPTIAARLAMPFALVSLLAACEPLPVVSVVADALRAAPDHVADDGGVPLSALPGCTFELFATLHVEGAGPAASFAGTIHFRISATGDDGAEIAYHGRLVPPHSTPYSEISVSILRRGAAEQALWSHTAKLDPGPNSDRKLHFGGQGPIDPVLAGELVATPAAFSVAVNPNPTEGGNEAEGNLGPVRGDAPRSLRDSGRTCFRGIE
jgi:hypothetical protein